MAVGKKTKTVSTQLQCPDCGNLLTIHRKISKQKEKNHIKHIYCPAKCKTVTGHIEVKDSLEIPSWIEEWQGDQCREN